LRIYPEKDKGHIILPLFEEGINEKNIEKKIEGGSFGGMIKIIRALCDYDEVLKDEIKEMSIGKGTRKFRNRRINVHYIKENIVKKGFDEVLRKSIAYKTIQNSPMAWEVNYEKLKEFVKVNKRYPRGK
jgi:hypothetical protein